METNKTRNVDVVDNEIPDIFIPCYLVRCDGIIYKPSIKSVRMTEAGCGLSSHPEIKTAHTEEGKNDMVLLSFKPRMNECLGKMAFESYGFGDYLLFDKDEALRMSRWILDKKVINLNDQFKDLERTKHTLDEHCKKTNEHNNKINW